MNNYDLKITTDLFDGPMSFMIDPRDEDRFSRLIKNPRELVQFINTCRWINENDL